MIPHATRAPALSGSWTLALAWTTSVLSTTLIQTISEICLVLISNAAVPFLWNEFLFSFSKTMKRSPLSLLCVFVKVTWSAPHPSSEKHRLGAQAESVHIRNFVYFFSSNHGRIYMLRDRILLLRSRDFQLNLWQCLQCSEMSIRKRLQDASFLSKFLWCGNKMTQSVLFKSKDVILWWRNKFNKNHQLI